MPTYQPTNQITQTVDWRIKVATLLGAACLILALWLVLRQMGMPISLSATAIATWLGTQGAAGPMLLIILMIIAVVIGPIPTLPVSAASGLAFGIAGGTLVAATGALIGAMIAFWISRVLGRDVVCYYLRDNPLFAGEHSQRLLFWIIFITRLIPLFSFALISYAAGVTAISAWRFALASLLGMLPMTVVFAGLGHNLEIHPLFTALAAALLLLAMTVTPYYLNRHHGALVARWLGQAPKPQAKHND